MPRNLDLAALRSFVAVAEMGGVTRAAQQLNLTQSAVSLRVKRLEAVELAIADDPLARQSTIDEAAEKAVKSSGRSTAGRAGQRGGNKRSKRRS